MIRIGAIRLTKDQIESWPRDIGYNSTRVLVTENGEQELAWFGFGRPTINDGVEPIWRFVRQ